MIPDYGFSAKSALGHVPMAPGGPDARLAEIEQALKFDSDHAYRRQLVAEFNRIWDETHERKVS